VPDAWQEIVTPEGERALVPDPDVRARQARVAGVFALVLAAATFAIARTIPGNPAAWAPALVVFALTLGATAGGVWLARGRWEWRIAPGRLTLRRRFGAGLRDVFDGRRLVLERTTDSDGDPWYELSALADPGAPPAPTLASWRSASAKRSRSIFRLMNDDLPVRGLGAWLARETGLVLDDRTTPDARKLELAQLRNLLEQSGRFGRWAAKVVDKVDDGRQGGA
jgi:hypothetical protein